MAKEKNSRIVEKRGCPLFYFMGVWKEPICRGFKGSIADGRPADCTIDLLLFGGFVNIH